MTSGGTFLSDTEQPTATSRQGSERPRREEKKERGCAAVSARLAHEPPWAAALPWAELGPRRAAQRSVIITVIAMSSWRFHSMPSTQPDDSPQWSSNSLPYSAPAIPRQQSNPSTYPPLSHPPSLGTTTTPTRYQPYSAGTQSSRAPSLPADLSSPIDPRTLQRMDLRDRDGDAKMDDADLYNQSKYSQSGPPSQRNSAYLPAPMEDGSASTAARRYSPMNTSPTSPYVQSPVQQGLHPHPSFTPQQQRLPSRQSPTRHNSYNTPSQNPYSSPSARSAQPQQLPPIQTPASPDQQHYPHSATAQLNALFGRETHSPQVRQPSPLPEPSNPASVPQFTKCTHVADLQPRVNAQPPFRRANPEGGFISPLQALTTHLPSTYRICNPHFQYESSRNPRRVLTKPSKGSKNDGYDNEDSDYILYVNDILGSEETNHKNRYLILDVLGQGTFGQVVKCQNLKTQEVVAVKVVKNRTAYFNQSMMEVSVLDLVRHTTIRSVLNAIC